MAAILRTLVILAVFVSVTLAMETNDQHETFYEDATFAMETVFAGAWDLPLLTEISMFEEIDQSLPLELDDYNTSLLDDAEGPIRFLGGCSPNAYDGLVAFTGAQFSLVDSIQEERASGFATRALVVNNDGTEDSPARPPTAYSQSQLDQQFEAGATTRYPQSHMQPVVWAIERHWCNHGGCRASFATSAALRHHQRSHTPMQDRRHSCPHCPKRFNYPRELVRHLSRHGPQYSTERFYCSDPDCPYSTRGFSRRDNLYRHRRSGRHREASDSTQYASLGG